MVTSYCPPTNDSKCATWNAPTKGIAEKVLTEDVFSCATTLSDLSALWSTEGILSISSADNSVLIKEIISDLAVIFASNVFIALMSKKLGTSGSFIAAYAEAFAI